MSENNQSFMSETFCWQTWWKNIVIAHDSKRGRMQKEIIHREITGKPLKLSKPQNCWSCTNKIH